MSSKSIDKTQKHIGENHENDNLQNFPIYPEEFFKEIKEDDSDDTMLCHFFQSHLSVLIRVNEARCDPSIYKSILLDLWDRCADASCPEWLKAKSAALKIKITPEHPLLQDALFLQRFKEMIVVAEEILSEDAVIKDNAKSLDAVVISGMYPEFVPERYRTILPGLDAAQSLPSIQQAFNWMRKNPEEQENIMTAYAGRVDNADPDPEKKRATLPIFIKAGLSQVTTPGNSRRFYNSGKFELDQYFLQTKMLTLLNSIPQRLQDSNNIENTLLDIIKEVLISSAEDIQYLFNNDINSLQIQIDNKKSNVVYDMLSIQFMPSLQLRDTERDSIISVLKLTITQMIASCLKNFIEPAPDFEGLKAQIETAYNPTSPDYSKIMPASDQRSTLTSYILCFALEDKHYDSEQAREKALDFVAQLNLPERERVTFTENFLSNDSNKEILQKIFSVEEPNKKIIRLFEKKYSEFLYNKLESAAKANDNAQLNALVKNLLPEKNRKSIDQIEDDYKKELHKALTAKTTENPQPVDLPIFYDNARIEYILLEKLEALNKRKPFGGAKPLKTILNSKHSLQVKLKLINAIATAKAENSWGSLGSRQTEVQTFYKSLSDFTSVNYDQEVCNSIDFKQFLKANRYIQSNLDDEHEEQRAVLRAEKNFSSYIDFSDIDSPVVESVPFQEKFTHWLGLSLVTKTVEDLYSRGAPDNVNVIKACYELLETKREPNVTAVTTSRVKSQPGKTDYLAQDQAAAFTRYLQDACLELNNDQAYGLWHRIEYKIDIESDALPALSELITDKIKMPPVVTWAIEQQCTGDELKNLKKVLVRFTKEDNIVSKLGSCFFKPTPPRGMQKVIALIDKPAASTADILLELKQVAADRLGQNIWGSRQLETQNAYQAIDKFFHPDQKDKNNPDYYTSFSSLEPKPSVSQLIISLDNILPEPNSHQASPS